MVQLFMPNSSYYGFCVSLTPLDQTGNNKNMANQKTQKKFLDKIILSLVVICIILILTHQINNLIDYNIPEPTQTSDGTNTNTNKFVIDVELRDEDILEDWFTPTPNP
jgi:hypothetical protein